MRPIHIQGSFFGAPIDWELEFTEEPSPPAGRDAAAVLAADQVQIAALAGRLADQAQALGLDDYGRFRLAVFAVDGLGVRMAAGQGGGPLTMGEALAAGVWDAAGRLLAVGAILRELGYAAAPLQRGDALLLGVPTS